MTDNMQYIIDATTTIINSKYGDSVPTIEQINDEAVKFRQIYSVDDSEFEQVKRELASSIIHDIGEMISLKGQDDAHLSWYYTQENDNFYWDRYKKFLRTRKRWSPEIVNRLNDTTSKVMDDLGDPNDKNRPFQRRGLLLGDVQSGKTATYTAICNKAADVGYKVIIVLAGMMENLRVQTQGRLDMEFVGKESKYTLDKKADNKIRNRQVGVGKISPSKGDKQIACFTSVATDFNKNTLRALGLSLSNLKGTALFVVKKNKSVLNNLYNWLLENNADDMDLIDLPLLLIDDEADNASVNTRSEEKNPTAINKAIRNILNCFRQASYIGITATPFANIFINPTSELDTGSRDLFPKDFLMVLPTPERYIGADRIFGNGDIDNWEDGSIERGEGEYGKAIMRIKNKEQDKFFYFKHKKEIADELYDLPESLKEAIRYFVLATAITDFRNDKKEHRSMLVNVSRFTKVQNRTAELIEDYISCIKADLENYSGLPYDKSMEIPSINELKVTWDKFNLENTLRIPIDRLFKPAESIGTNSQLLTNPKLKWKNCLRTYLYNAINRVLVRSVNQQHGASTLNYYEYSKTGMRVIAVGGNSLSRGLTLEGLCVSYFYRNTMMYDTLLQMGRWFGYRPNYDDIFKIWMGEDSVDWYGYITDAVNELKDELRKMERQNQTPEQFGLKVRQAPGALLITARNKMRSATNVKRLITPSQRMIETPRLKGDVKSLSDNEKLCRDFLYSLSKIEINVILDEYTNSYIWKKIPKKFIANMVKAFKTHPWNLNFQPIALADYINDDETNEYWDVAIPQGKKSGLASESITLFGEELKIVPESRRLEWDNNIKNMLRVNGHHVRVGTGGCSKIGLDKHSIMSIREKCKSNGEKVTDKSYLIQNRQPIMLIHILKNNKPINERTDRDPDIVFALGLGFPYNGIMKEAKYVVNVTELKNWVDIVDEDDDDED